MKKLKESLIAIQAELKAPKGQYNSFGGYKYRSCEDILEAVKPLLKKNGCALTLRDSVELIGDRYYIKSTACLTDGDDYCVEVEGYAREEETKKGMDGSQLTGTASSYARKYALNGLFLIDDTKDADTDEHAKQVAKEEPKASPKQLELIRKIAEEQGKKIDEAKLAGWTMKQASDFITKAKGAK